jgi:hypothetical protein
VIDKAIDKIRDKVVDFAMYEGAKYIGGPFRGGDEDVTRDVLTEIIDPREWYKAPIKIFTKGLRSAKTVPQIGDTPGADPATQSSRLPVQQGGPQGSGTRPKDSADVSSHQAQAPDTDFVTAAASVASAQGHTTRENSASAKADKAAPESRPQDVSAASPSQPQTLASGQQKMDQAPQKDFILGSDGHFSTVPHESRAAQPSVTAQPATAPAQAPARAPDHGGPPGHDPATGSHEIFRGVDKPDHNTPGGRDGGPPS